MGQRIYSWYRPGQQHGSELRPEQILDAMQLLHLQITVSDTKIFTTTITTLPPTSPCANPFSRIICNMGHQAFDILEVKQNRIFLSQYSPIFQGKQVKR